MLLWYDVVVSFFGTSRLGYLFGRDFVTGFHKRKKKRRKEAQKVLQEKERKRKIQERKRVRNSS